MISVIRDEALRQGGVLRFDAFVRLALYHPVHGYYVRERARVGRSRDTDFYTATSVGPVFGRLVVDAVTRLCEARGGDASGMVFVEVGAERGGGVLDGLPHPFAGARCVRVGEPVELNGPTVVFSNELLDAQPFRRFVFAHGQWREIGVRVEGGALVEALLEDTGEVPGFLEAAGQDLDAGGAPVYFDWPSGAEGLLRDIAGQPWSGLWLAFDYGRAGVLELLENCPQGTARAYWRHEQCNELLARPGEQDLTCHLCWERLNAVLSGAGFGEPATARQEAFFMQHAAGEIERILTAEHTGISTDKQALKALLHPAHFGMKFQAQWAWRD